MIKTYKCPIVVDLDGTLVKTDTLYESIFQLIKTSPVYFLLLPIWLLKGKAIFKSKIAETVELRPELLPYNTALIEYLYDQRKQGRSIHLATAAHRSIAIKVFDHLGIFDSWMASDLTENLKGARKAKKIKEEIGPVFSYAGDHAADIPIWEQSESAILVGVEGNIAGRVSINTSIEKEFHSDKVPLKAWVKACRLHQWLKNTLIFVPLLTAFDFTELDKVYDAFLAFISFSLLASATYILNDLWDLTPDRLHPTKRKRPFASGEIPILHGLLVSMTLLFVGMALGATLSVAFFYMLTVYLVITVSYSLVFKEYVLLDVILLSLLFTIRILSGSVAISVDTSTWLLSFSMFIFFSLALVKRCSELTNLQQRGEEATKGRDYRVSDLVIFWPLGVGSALSAIVIFGLFINDPETQLKYSTPEFLWLASIGLIYWITRLWIKTARGEMYDDPVVYAIKNRGSLITIVAIVLVILTAHFVSF